MEETDPMFADQPISPTHDTSYDVTTTATNHSNTNNSNSTSLPTREIKREHFDNTDDIAHNEKTFAQPRPQQGVKEMYSNSYTPSSTSNQRALDWRAATTTTQAPISSTN